MYVPPFTEKNETGPWFGRVGGFPLAGVVRSPVYRKERGGPLVQQGRRFCSDRRINGCSFVPLARDFQTFPGEHCGGKFSSRDLVLGLLCVYVAY